MARKLEDLVNVDAPSSDYPYGRVRDNPGNGTGTPVNEASWGDTHQFFARLMAQAGIAPNGLPDNEYSGFQLNEALEEIIRIKTEKDQLSMAISGGGIAISTGVKGFRRVPFAFRVTGWEIVSQQSATAAVDIWRQVYASLPATNSESIVTPSLSASIKNQDLALGSPIDLAEGDYLYYNVDSNNNSQNMVITLIGTRIFTPL